MDQTELRLLLDGYEPSDSAEACHREAMLHLLNDGVSSWSREQFDPGHFTASAYVVDESGCHVAMIRHRALGRWLQPGGHVDDGDADAAFAARRELKEETGLDMRGGGALFDLDVHVIPARPGMPEHRHFDLRFLFILSGCGELPRLDAADDAEGAAWMPVEFLLEHGESGMERVAWKIRAKFCGSVS